MDFIFFYGEVGIGMMIVNGNNVRFLIIMEFFELFGISLWFVIVIIIFMIFVVLWILDCKMGEYYFKSKSFFLEREKKYFKRRLRVILFESMLYMWSMFVYVLVGSGCLRSVSFCFVVIFFVFVMIILSSIYIVNFVVNKVKDEVELLIIGICDEKVSCYRIIGCFSINLLRFFCFCFDVKF